MKTYFLILSLVLSVAGNIQLSVRSSHQSNKIYRMQVDSVMMRSKIDTVDSILNNINKQWILIKQIEANYIREMDSID